MSNSYFYRDLSEQNNFLDITNPEAFVDFDETWIVVASDIKGSTIAIEAGKYKEVNTIAASSIVCLLNLNKELDIPFVFGGDGSAVLIPPNMLLQAKASMLALQEMSMKSFGLELRIGFVPIKDIVEGGFKVKVCKFKVSDNYVQAIFSGGGLVYAESLIKNPETADKYSYVEKEIVPNADFSGLECRWQDIRSKHGETLSVIVKAMGKEEFAENEIYMDVIGNIEKIYGEKKQRHPIQYENLNLSIDPKRLNVETKVRTYAKSVGLKLNYSISLFYKTFFAKIFLATGINYGDTDFKKLKDDVIRATDSEKFDDILRMVISGNHKQRMELEEYFEKMYREKKLAYGIHFTDRALLTCLVFERGGKEVHFVDAADGGYALAAKGYKERVKNLSPKT